MPRRDARRTADGFHRTLPISKDSGIMKGKVDNVYDEKWRKGKIEGART